MFNLKHKLVAAALLTTSILPQAFAAMTDAQLSLAMRNDIKKYIVTVKSPKIIFHWVDASDINPAGQYNTKFPSTAPHFKTYVQKQGARILTKRPAADPDLYGQGLYLASSPTESRSYGGQNSFGLIVGILSPGARLLAQSGDLPMEASISAEIARRGCGDNGGYIALLDTFDVKCTKVKQILVGADVSFADGRLYNWGGESSRGCSGMNPARDFTAVRGHDISDLQTFVAYNTKLFTGIFGYTHKTSVSGNAMADQILSYLKGLQTLGVYDNLISKDQMKDASIKAMSDADVKKFSQANILGCLK
jgi:hypothetical protein